MFSSMFARKPDKAVAMKQLRTHVTMFGVWVAVVRGLRLQHFLSWAERDLGWVNTLSELSMIHSLFWVKINVDIAMEEPDNLAMSGIAVRNSEGHLLTISSTVYRCSDVLIGETLALREALWLADNLDIEEAIFESDSALLIQNMKKLSQDRSWKIAGLCEDMDAVRKRRTKYCFEKINREANIVAHFIANLAKRERSPVNRLCDVPVELANILATDMATHCNTDLPYSNTS